MGHSLTIGNTDVEEGTDRWLTPRWILDGLGEFDLDPCGAPGWQTAREVWTPEEVGDGLSMPWHGRVWLNPPYGNAMGAWLERMAEHCSGVALIFARTDIAIWHEFVKPHAIAYLFIRGRLTFLRPDATEADYNSGAPSVLIAYSDADATAIANSGIEGHVHARTSQLWDGFKRMKPRLCDICDHSVNVHSHMGTHECKADGCLCLAYLSRTP